MRALQLINTIKIDGLAVVEGDSTFLLRGKGVAEGKEEDVRGEDLEYDRRV